MRFSIVQPVTIAAVALIHTANPVLAACGFDKVGLLTDPGFTITVNSNYKVLEDTAAKVKYGLYCDDTQPSDVAGIDRWFKVPVESVGLRISMASGFLEALGHSDKLIAAESPRNLTNICLDASKIQTLDPASTTSNSSSVDVIFSADEGSDSNISVRLPSNDALTPLQKAEWIKFVAAFFNDEKSADSLFSSIADAYNCHWGNLQHLKDAPHAYWVQYTDGATPSYSIIDTAYQKDLLAGAGATNNTRAALDDSSDQAAFQDAIKDADFVFDQSELHSYGQRATEWYSNFGYKNPKNSGVTFLTSRNIWRTDGFTNKAGVSNFAEFGYVRPDLVLQDIISVLEPKYDTDYSRRWLLWLGGTNESTTVISPDNYDCAKPWFSTVDKCSARTDFTGDSDSDTPDSEADDTDSDSGSGSGRAGKIAGGVIGAAVFVALVIVALHYYNRHRRNVRIQALAQAEYGTDGIDLRDTRRFS
ncbi:hypothetical protein COEREDRAFT_80197 [Coemansia reversa NRRL 1564]|uniref:Periplasmic binding protein n=1 Tax=Coemansia reversa (strain ATCC 12441 / NRRL 1564) TaxID=763665 RepID=A0A2G5BFU1_COERN|nr:hypothetical protein COEREDRAFT_80197 [Coemansia reversa NRRL 1564]|eukprot:PIA17870.1 hypothetical protein COEREDRAFT_80197 [Coemansia reversa NRRL 1564]